ncbi:MAG: radical SAM protein [Alphaproteobacteria bacterium]|nr:radical SAM protein [Alphaproteobacteria bacterium]MBL6951193.1 radical SAM protein [Alphaproteobacteria bacterium]
MKAKVSPRIHLEERTLLQEVLPLETPFILNVDPASACNFKCAFCPTGHRDMIKDTGRFQGAMRFDVYEKIIADLEDFSGSLKVLRLYKDGEPLLNKRFADMVRLGKQSKKVETVDTTTNASLFTFERMKPVIDAGIDRINISIDGMSDAGYLENVGIDVSFDQVVREIEAIYKYKTNTEIFVKTMDELLGEESRERFFEIFGNISDTIFIENLSPCWPNFDVQTIMGMEITEGIYGQPIKEVKTCPYLFYSMSVNSDGSVSTCFLDWSRDLLIGDVRQNSVKEIWHGDQMNHYRRMHLEGRRSEHKLCGSCGQMSHCWPDNIDEYRDEIAERFQDRYQSAAE